MPVWTRSGATARVLARLQDERGIALVMAIGIMFVLTITVSSVMVYTAASAGHANNSNAGQKAYALAEAGVNNAFAVLNAKLSGYDGRIPGQPRIGARHDRRPTRLAPRTGAGRRGPIGLISVEMAMANRVHRHVRIRPGPGRAGDAQATAIVADRHSDDDAGERDRR